MTMATPGLIHTLCSCSSSPLPSSWPSLMSPRLATPLPQCQPMLPPITKSRRSGIQIAEKWRIAARYVKFKVEEAEEPEADNVGDSSDDMPDDSVLPANLEGAVLQSSQSSAKFISAGGMRAIVELMLPELEFLNDEGSQEELWELARLYLESVTKETGVQRLKAIFPDAGAAALVKHWWKDASFNFASLSDRKPVEDEDEIIVMISPDYQMLKDVERIASLLSSDLPRPLVMWNPRLFSGDVGVGLSIRRLRSYFLSTFTVVYSMRPLQSGAIFRRYPGLWKVFMDDKERPGRYVLATEQPRRPDADDIDLLFLDDEREGAKEKPSFFVEAMGMFSSFNRFMRSLSK
eukprot:Gb_35506 [translate_table: standard]